VATVFAQAINVFILPLLYAALAAVFFASLLFVGIGARCKLNDSTELRTGGLNFVRSLGCA
jgi:hypothetical protein